MLRHFMCASNDSGSFFAPRFMRGVIRTLLAWVLPLLITRCYRWRRLSFLLSLSYRLCWDTPRLKARSSSASEHRR